MVRYGEEETFYSTIIKSQTFSEHIGLDYKIHNSFSNIFPQLGGDKLARMS